MGAVHDSARILEGPYGLWRGEFTCVPPCARICPDSDGCLSLVGGTGLSFSRKDRTLMALSFALDTVWEGVEA